MNNKPVVLYYAVSLCFFILQSLFPGSYAIPDIGFIVLVFFSIYCGPLFGTFSGFLGGLAVDFLSLSPLGFHAAIFLLIGYLSGRLKGKLLVDPIIVPLLIVVFSQMLKTATGFILLQFLYDSSSLHFFYGDFWRKLFFGSISAPFIYFVLKLFRLIDLNARG